MDDHFHSYLYFDCVCIRVIVFFPQEALYSPARWAQINAAKCEPGVDPDGMGEARPVPFAIHGDFCPCDRGCGDRVGIDDDHSDGKTYKQRPGHNYGSVF